MQSYIVNQGNIDQVEGFPGVYCIGIGDLGDGTAVVSFHVNWIDIQIKADADNIYMRLHYGSNGWSAWVRIVNFQ